MTEVKLRFRPSRERKAAPVAYYKPEDVDDGRGPSVLVNQAFVEAYFANVKPERARLTLIVDDIPF